MTRLKFLDQGYGWPTVRKHPRTLAQAWPEDYADPISHEPSHLSWLASDIVIAAVLVLTILALCFGFVR